MVVKQPPSAVLGIAFEGNRAHVAVLRRSGTNLQVTKTFAFDLSQSPLTGDSAAIAAELRNKLEEEKIREKHCVVAFPLNWMLTMQTKIPAIPEPDVPAFLDIESERSFPYGPESMFISTSRCRFPNEEQYATLVGVPREQAEQIQQVLKAAQLKPASFTIGIAAMLNPEEVGEEAIIAFYVGANAVELLITCGNGIAALRSLEGAIETTESGRRVSTDLIARELRITLGQLPTELRSRIKSVRLLGERALTESFAAELSPRLAAMGITVALANTCSGAFATRIVSDKKEANPAVCTAARYLVQSKTPFEFLPPKTSSWKQFSTRVSSRKLIWAGATAGAAAVLVAGAFFIQSWELSKLRNQWSGMEPRVRELETMQANIKKYRPWFDTSFHTLSILKKVTETFPVDGVVTAKTVEMRDQNLVTCSGTARDTAAFYRMYDQLRNSKEITDISQDVIRGKNPLQFNFNFRWVEGRANEGQ
jgi:hypothetical protein